MSSDKAIWWRFSVVVPFASALVTVGAMTAALWNAHSARQSAKAALANASAAKRSADIAELNEHNTRRSADAAEQREEARRRAEEEIHLRAVITRARSDSDSWLPTTDGDPWIVSIVNDGRPINIEDVLFVYAHAPRTDSDYRGPQYEPPNDFNLNLGKFDPLRWEFSARDLQAGPSFPLRLSRFETTGFPVFAARCDRKPRRLEDFVATEDLPFLRQEVLVQSDGKRTPITPEPPPPSPDDTTVEYFDQNGAIVERTYRGFGGAIRPRWLHEYVSVDQRRPPRTATIPWLVRVDHSCELREVTVLTTDRLRLTISHTQFEFEGR